MLSTGVLVVPYQLINIRTRLRMLGKVELFPEAGRLDFKVLGVHLCYHNFSRDEKVVGTEHKQPFVQKVEQESF